MAQTTSVFGINSGFDTATVVDQLISLQGRPIDIKLAKREAEEVKLTTFQDLKSRLQTFKSVLGRINTENRFLTTKGEFAQTGTTTSDIVDISTSSQATSGSYSLSVNNLAQEAKVISGGFESISSIIEPGTFEVSVGGKTTLIAVDSANNSLDGLRLAINNSGADVTASFLNDGTSENPVRLILTGNKTGAENSISARLFTSFIGAGEFDTMTFSETQEAKDASFSVDGINITKSSNTVSDVIAGTSLTLKGTGTGTVKLSTDFDTIGDKVEDFVNGYNDLSSFLKDQLSFNQETLETGTLFGNFAVQSLQNTLRSSITSRIDTQGGQFEFLAQIGIRTQSDGSLTFERSSLNDALALDPKNISLLFSSKGTTTDSSVTFIGFTSQTEAGSFDLRVVGGVPQLSKSGENNFVNAVGSGNFFSGAEGTDAEGLNFRLGDLSDGNYGSINLSVGIGEELNRFVSELTDSSKKGPIQSELDTVTQTIDDLNDTIFDLDERLELFETNIRERFVNLEIILGRLNTQKESFTSSIANINNIFK